MALNKPLTLILIISLSSLLSFSTEAHRHASYNGSGSLSSSTTSSSAPAPTSMDLESNFWFEISHFLTVPTFELKSLPHGIFHTCSVTENPFKCCAFVAPFLSGTGGVHNAPGSVDAGLVLQMQIKALHQLVSRAISIAKKFKSYSSTSPAARTCLDISIEIYGTVIEDLHKALAACATHDNALVHSLLRAAITKFGKCDETFIKYGLDHSLMKEIDQRMIEVAGYCLAISTKFVHKVVF